MKKGLRAGRREGNKKTIRQIKSKRKCIIFKRKYQNHAAGATVEPKNDQTDGGMMFEF